MLVVAVVNWASSADVIRSFVVTEGPLVVTRNVLCGGVGDDFGGRCRGGGVLGGGSGGGGLGGGSGGGDIGAGR